MSVAYLIEPFLSKSPTNGIVVLNYSPIVVVIDGRAIEYDSIKLVVVENL